MLLRQIELWNSKRDVLPPNKGQVAIWIPVCAISFIVVLCSSLFVEAEEKSDQIGPNTVMQALQLVDTALQCPVPNKLDQGKTTHTETVFIGDENIFGVKISNIEFNLTPSLNLYGEEPNEVIGTISRTITQYAFNWSHLGSVEIIDDLLAFKCKGEGKCISKYFWKNKNTDYYLDGSEYSYDDVRASDIGGNIDHPTADIISLSQASISHLCFTQLKNLQLAIAILASKEFIGVTAMEDGQIYVPRNVPNLKGLIIRSAPHKNAHPVGAIPVKAEPFQLSGCKAVAGYKRPWCKIKWGKLDGWISTTMLEKGKAMYKAKYCIAVAVLATLTTLLFQPAWAQRSYTLDQLVAEVRAKICHNWNEIPDENMSEICKAYKDACDASDWTDLRNVWGGACKQHRDCQDQVLRDKRKIYEINSFIRKCNARNRSKGNDVEYKTITLRSAGLSDIKAGTQIDLSQQLQDATQRAAGASKANSANLSAARNSFYDKVNVTVSEYSDKLDEAAKKMQAEKDRKFLEEKKRLADELKDKEYKNDPAPLIGDPLDENVCMSDCLANTTYQNKGAPQSLYRRCQCAAIPCGLWNGWLNGTGRSNNDYYGRVCGQQ